MHEDVCGMKVWLYAFVTLAVHVDDLVSSMPQTLHPFTLRLGGWVGPKEKCLALVEN